MSVKFEVVEYGILLIIIMIFNSNYLRKVIKYIKSFIFWKLYYLSNFSNQNQWILKE